MKRFLNIVPALILAGSHSASAAIVATSDDFDTGITANGTWLDVGTVAHGGINHDGTSTFDLGLSGGDFLAQDGGLRMNSIDATQQNEAIGLTIGGTMSTGEIITFSYGLYNDNSSFNSTIALLYNLTDAVVIASNGPDTVNGSATADPKDLSFNYTALASDDGDTLQIRFVENNNNVARDTFIDNYSVTSVPEPSSSALVGIAGMAMLLRRRK
ncbi:MAG: PEP-CTERM sorting domain-containing protein [Akkermansiaceae bacterium]